MDSVKSIPDRSAGKPGWLGPVAAGLLAVGSVLAVFSCSPSFFDALLIPIAVVVVILLAARQLGAWIIRGNAEEDLVAGALMLSFIPVINQVLGVSLAPVSWAVVVVCLAMVSCVRASKREDLADLGKRLEKDAADAGIFGILFFLAGIAALAWVFTATLAPPVGMDALAYHLGLPMQYLARGTLRPPDALVYYQYTQAGEMLGLLTLPFDRSGVAAGILLGLALPAAAVASGRMAGELAMVSDKRSRAAAALARILGFAAVATVPVALFTVAHTKTDAFAMALALLGVRRAVTRAHCPFRAAFFLGGAVAVKLTAGYVAGPTLLWILWRERRRPQVFAAVAVLAALAPSYWLLRNIVATAHLIPQVGYLAAGTAGAVGGGLADRIARIFASTFLFVNPGIDGPMGSVAAALVFFAVAGLGASRRHLRTVSSFAVVAFALWFITGGGSHRYAGGGLLRFLLPSIAVALSAGAAVAAELVLPRGERTASGRLLGAFLALGLVVNLGVGVVILARAMPFLEVLSGRITRDTYVQGWCSTFALQQEGARVLPKKARVLSVGESRLFYLGRDARYDADADLPSVYRVLRDSGHETAALDPYIATQGITHVLHAADVYARNILVGLAPAPSAYADRARFEEWLKHRTRVIASDGAAQATLYEVLPAGAITDSPLVSNRH